ncbi:MAG: STAS domain-containing protein [Candidatus Contendobacter sp.]|jgi:anti-anti-sigma regulatory factor|nr:STAS domain-containing protein [Gammaproteobacteria bacterium]MCC8995242.1 STAS domain-containing protein [Candidatus Contendobacter sp.]
MATIECQPELDIAAAGALHRQLLSALQAQEPVDIDGQAVRKVHTAALQLFLNLSVEARLQKLPVRWRKPSPALIEGARLLGLADSLGLGEAGEDSA